MSFPPGYEPRTGGGHGWIHYLMPSGSKVVLRRWKHNIENPPEGHHNWGARYEGVRGEKYIGYRYETPAEALVALDMEWEKSLTHAQKLKNKDDEAERQTQLRIRAKRRNAIKTKVARLKKALDNEDWETAAVLLGWMK